MCKGFFFKGAPTVVAFVLFPLRSVQMEKDGVSPLPLEFLVDTGADKTMISGADVSKLGINYRPADGTLVPFLEDQPLEKGQNMGGVGGGIKTYVVPNVNLYFISDLGDRREIHEENLDQLYVPEGKVKDIPNLLGRDMLTRFDIVWKSQEPSIELSRSLEFGSYRVNILPISEV